MSTSVSTPLGDASPRVAFPLRRRRPGRAQRLLQANKAAAVSGVFLVLLVLSAILADWLTPFQPTSGSIAESLRPPVFFGGQLPNLLGTDQLGRDILTRILYASRISLAVGLAGVLVAGTIGTLIGLVAGFRGGLWDEVGMRLADVQLAFPVILFAIAVVAVIGPSLVNVMIVLGVSRWTAYARTIRGSTLSLRNREFVHAARSLGATDARLLFRHILPNTVAPLTVLATFTMANVIVAEASLSFLGLGVQPPTPTWGGMLSDGRQYISSAWWLTIFPGLALAVTMLAINTLGDWLRDVLDPTLQT